MPTHPARARELLRKGRARVAQLTPFTIRIIDRRVEDSVVDGVYISIDPGSKHTGVATYREEETTDQPDASPNRVGLAAYQIEHRGDQIHKKMEQRKNYRRRRRGKNLRYRAPRFDNRKRREGWLPPSLQSRVDNTISIITRLSRILPIREIRFEATSFDTQLMVNPSVSGVEYQRGALHGYEVREYLLEKWGRQCAYCDATGVPLQVEHIHPRSRGGSDRVGNLTLACEPCNQRKGALSVEVFLAHDPRRLARIKRTMTAPLKHAAITQTTRNAVHRGLTVLAASIGATVSTGTGGRTKWQRSANGLSKTHTLDALCVGGDSLVPARVVRYPNTVLVIKAAGRGSYQRTKPDKYGFPRLYYPRTKRFFKVATGDHVRAIVPTGKFEGVWTGRIAVRSSGYFQVAGATVHHRLVTVLQRADGYGYTTQPEGTL